MKRWMMLFGLACLAAACGNEQEVVFYSVTYPVVRLGAYVTLAAQPVDPEAPDDADADDTEAREQALAAEVLAEAPVEAGGSYRLDYSRYNGGTLTVIPAAGAGAIAGEFVKEPGSAQLEMAYDQHVYTCDISSYTSDDGIRCVLLTVDLTEIYQARYPDAGILRVQRSEYTATPVNQ